ncbi:MAG: hypothetical protein A3F18_02210 [Legionellales bacterium RIFCSPHIGHO2_12_FULL_37_14]|nr:MAG: hypothetical protein A3F18_02210 [Legionellales bacterium RIFCSPHIGHO2_12_FULL_37_14]
MLIDIDGLEVKLHRKKIKNINLRIKNCGTVFLSIPYKLALDEAFEFIKNKRLWIDFHLTNLKAEANDKPRLFIPGEFIFFLGKRYELMLHKSYTKNSIKLHQGTINFYLKEDISIAKKQALLNHWYLLKMQKMLPSLLQKWEKIIGVKVYTVHIRNMQTRWGSCTPTKQRISLNIKLMEKPLRCLEYVIVHELVHLIEASHNKHFHALMTKFMPDWKLIKAKLK